MKTFKIVTLQILENKYARDIPLTDGLIINKENEDQEWIIEAYIDKKFEDLFQKRYQENKTFEIRVIITHPANDPASFIVNVHTIKRLENHISVLFEGQLSRRRSDYSELLLEDLVKEGYSGEELTKEFKLRIKAKQPVAGTTKDKS